MNNKENAKQALIGFTEFAKGITGNQNLKIPDDIAKRYGINTDSEQEHCKMTAKEADNIRNSIMAIKATQKQSCEDEDITKAFQLGLALGLEEKHSCEDCISRQAVLEKAINVPIAKIVTDDKVICRKVIFVDDVEKLPPVTPKHKMGQWIDDKCSKCGKGIEDLIDSPEWYRNEEPNFCPFCGIKMEKAESE